MRKFTGSSIALPSTGRNGGGRRPANGVQSVLRALRLIDTLGESRGEVGLADLSGRVKLHVSTVHRLLTTLVQHGYCRQNPETGRYALGAKLFHLAESYLGQMDLRQVARPHLERLCRETGETANLVVLDGREALYLDKAESPQNLRIFSRIGHRAPLYCTAVGKVLLAARTPPEASDLLGPGPLEPMTRRTITALPQLQQELAKVRAQGYALDLEECEEGARCVAAPIRVAAGEVVAAVGVSGPSIRMRPKRVRELTPLLVRTAAMISQQLGCPESVLGTP